MNILLKLLKASKRKENGKNVKFYITRLGLRMFYIFPIKQNRLFFTSYEGKNYSCNPKYIYMELRKRNSNLEYVWELNDLKRRAGMGNEVKLVGHNTLPYIYYIMTAGVLVSNSGISPIFPLRSKQININTWHGGGAYKKGGIDIGQELNGTSLQRIKKAGQQTTYFISSSERFTQIMSHSLMIDIKKFLPYGMPRNDIFFSEGIQEFDRIRQQFKLKEEKLVLYAPTYRGNAGANVMTNVSELNIKELLRTLEKKFGGNWKCLFRSHYFGAGDIEIDESTIDVSQYPDMQELLCLADVLITDYSSSVWDFSFTRKPGFLYVPDLEKYISERDFYMSIYDWPYPVCKTFSDLKTSILNFNIEIQIERNIHHHRELKCYETGEASQKTAELILRMQEE